MELEYKGFIISQDLRFKDYGIYNKKGFKVINENFKSIELAKLKIDNEDIN